MKLPPFALANLECQPGLPAAALLRAAEAWPPATRGSQLQTILQTAGRQPPRFLVLAAATTDPGDLPRAAVLVETLPGRSAVVMTPQVEPSLPKAERDELAREMLQALDAELQQAGVLLAQALSGGSPDPATAWFLSAGYRNVGELLYLSADLKTALAQPNPPPLLGELELIPHPPADLVRWIPLVERTYLHSLDCPAVDGLRPTRDVLIGYQDIGRPRDDWWFVVREAGEDIGCLFLADHRPADHAELVYMGLVPDARGRGWGVYLAREAQRIAATSGASQLVLSVDAANMPALRHYQSAGFRFWEQRSILIKSLA